MPRFFVPPEQLRDNHFLLTGSEARHAVKVLRKKVGDVIDLFDGKDSSFLGRIDSISADHVTGVILASNAGTKMAAEVTLYQALIKGPKWDWLLEKACEIGVTRVVPIATVRTVVKVSAKDAEQKLPRWRRIALEASKQCGRNVVMTVEKPLPFGSAVSRIAVGSFSLIPWEKESEMTIRQAMQRTVQRTQPVNIFIGPEGGWETQEIDQAIRHGVIPVRLGPTLLRSETAGLVAATLALCELNIYS